MMGHCYIRYLCKLNMKRYARSAQVADLTHTHTQTHTQGVEVI